jgi:glutathione S-transferase
MSQEISMLTIYHAEGRRSERIVWFCEEIGLPYTLVFKEGDLMESGRLAREVNPLMAMFPTVTYGDAVLVESAAILQLLQERHGDGRLVPAAASPDYPKYLQWLHFAESSGAPRLITEFLLNRAIQGEPPPLVKHQLGRSDQVLRYTEDFLSVHPYFGGDDFSLADIMMHFDINFISLVAKHDMTPYPHNMAWFRKVEERPAFKKMRQVSLPNGFIGVPS